MLGMYTPIVSHIAIQMMLNTCDFWLHPARAFPEALQILLEVVGINYADFVGSGRDPLSNRSA